MPTPQERIDALEEKIRNASYSTKEEKIALVQEMRAAKKELIGDRDLTQPWQTSPPSKLKMARKTQHQL